MTDIIEAVKKEVYERCTKDTNQYGMGAWTHHILMVYDVATEIYKEYNADYEIVALAALLHDVAAVTSPDYAEEHHIFGAQIADEILSGFNYDRNKIELIKNCVLNHRGSVVMEKLTGEEVCIADADALAHFYSIASLFNMVYREKEMGIDAGSDFILGKLERSYSKLSDIGKKYIEDRYNAAKLILGRKK